MSKLKLAFLCVAILILLLLPSINAFAYDEIVYSMSDEQADAYKIILENQIKKYGFFNEYQYNGVGYADIIEFNGDNNPELLIAYATDYSKDSVYFKIFGYDYGTYGYEYSTYEITEVKVASATEQKADFTVSRIGDTAYIQTWEHGPFDSTINVGTVKEKKWSVDKYYNYTYLEGNEKYFPDYPKNDVYMINNKQVSELEHDTALYSHIGNNPDDIVFKRNWADELLAGLSEKLNRNKRFEKTDITDDVLGIYISELKYMEDETLKGNAFANGYYIYDIDKNNVPELIVKSGTCEADYYFDILTVNNGKILRIGSFTGGHTYLCSTPEHGLIAYSAHMGYERINYYTLFDNLVFCKTVFQADCSNKPYNYHMSIDKFYNGAFILPYCDNITDYTLLSEYFSEKKVFGYNEMFVDVILDGNSLSFDSSPLIINDRTLVPFRKIFEELGASVSWDKISETVTAVKDDTTVILTIGKNEMYINGEMVWLDVTPILVYERTLVPVRAIAEAFSCNVNWDEPNFKIYIDTI